MVPFVFAMLIFMHRKFMFTDVHIDNFEEVQAHYSIKSMYRASAPLSNGSHFPHALS